MIASWIVVIASSSAPVIGGSDAGDRWPDAAAIVYDDGDVGCSGVLIAPTLVLTAGHCNDATLARVWIGSGSRTALGDGEEIEVVERIEYPDSWHTFDVTVLRLARASTKPARPIAGGWMRHEIADGAAVALVGFGAVDASGTRTVDALQEADSRITDAACAWSEGCNETVRPGGELGAGGGGIDTCPGDSGGPLYLVTEEGAFLAGITSRGYRSNTLPCSEGGIYVRPDALVAWIEEVTGVELPAPPGPHADAIAIAPGDATVVVIDPGDPRGGAHTFELVGAPAHGRARVDGSGRVTYAADATWTGDDAITVRVTDAADPARAVEMTIPVDVSDGGGGCSSGAASGGAAPLTLGALALRRRRRTR